MGSKMRKGMVGLGVVLAVLLGGTLANWTWQWTGSMKSRADHQCTDVKDKLLLVPGELFDPDGYGEAQNGRYTPGFEYVSCEDLVGKGK